MWKCSISFNHQTRLLGVSDHNYLVDGETEAERGERTESCRNLSLKSRHWASKPVVLSTTLCNFQVRDRTMPWWKEMLTFPSCPKKSPIATLFPEIEVLIYWFSIQDLWRSGFQLFSQSISHHSHPHTLKRNATATCLSVVLQAFSACRLCFHACPCLWQCLQN